MEQRNGKVGDLEADLEFLMRAALKVETIREDLGKVGPVIASQVEEAMLGRHRRPGSHVPYKSLVELRAVYMPDVARSVSGHPPN
jgi:hypothetical protein